MFRHNFVIILVIVVRTFFPPCCSDHSVIYFIFVDYRIHYH